MSENLKNLIDWNTVDAIIHSQEDHPHNALGAHITDKGILFLTFLPTAKAVSLVIRKKEIPMEKMAEEGIFAALFPGEQIPAYAYKVTYENGESQLCKDPYVFGPQITEKDTKRFNAGICYDIYEKLGAHPMKVNGVKGVYFAVWAPNAVRVSVVGDFNAWDGRRLPMRRLWDSGIFELFVPDIPEGSIYKYEIKAASGMVYLKADPYANSAEFRPNTASVVADLADYSWNDREWLKNRKKQDLKKSPMAIYEMHMGSWKKPEDGSFYNCRELAPLVADYVKKMGYTHIELMPIMEHPFDGSWGYQVTGYYAPTSRYGTPKDFMYFIDYLHQQGIGVILDWVPAHFPRDTFGLCSFDGTCLYEHMDPRKGSHPHWGTLIYNYARPEVSNFLIANALFWAEKYHVDGIRVDAVASMLYLDYGKKDGEWVPNMYGGNENLDAVEFFKHLNSIMKKQHPDVAMIAEESTAWPKITSPVEEEGLGFDYKWNMGWMNDFLRYMALEPIYRGYHHNELTFSMIYAYSEDFILPFSHDEVVHGKASLLGKMPGGSADQFANLRAAYGYMMVHPGKKLLFMGQEFAQISEWSEAKSLDWNLLEREEHQKLQQFVKALNQFYQSQPALYQLDYDPSGFTWINGMTADENMLAFTRNTKKKEDTLVVIVNFSPLTYEKHKVGVPYPGKYKEIFNTDKVEFGGTGAGNPRVKQSKKEECDERPDSITITVPPTSVIVFSYEKVAPKAKTNKEAKEAKAGKAEENKAAEPVKKAEKTAGTASAGAKKAPAKTTAKKKTLREGIVEKIDEAAKKVIERKGRNVQ